MSNELFFGRQEEDSTDLNTSRDKEPSVDEILADLGLGKRGQETAPSFSASKPEQTEQESSPNTAPENGEENKNGPARSTMSFWDAPEQPESPNPRSGHTKNEPSVEDTQSIQAPRLSETIQMDKDFQKFFSESIAVIPDLKEDDEEHPGFFARFVRKRKHTSASTEEIDTLDEGLYGQKEYPDKAYATREIALVYQDTEELPPVPSEPVAPPVKEQAPGKKAKKAGLFSFLKKKKRDTDAVQEMAPVEEESFLHSEQQTEPFDLAVQSAEPAPKATSEMEEPTGTILLHLQQKANPAEQTGAEVDEPTGTILLNLEQVPAPEQKAPSFHDDVEQKSVDVPSGKQEQDTQPIPEKTDRQTTKTLDLERLGLAGISKQDTKPVELPGKTTENIPVQDTKTLDLAQDTAPVAETDVNQGDTKALDLQAQQTEAEGQPVDSEPEFQEEAVQRPSLKESLFAWWENLRQRLPQMVGSVEPSEEAPTEKASKDWEYTQLSDAPQVEQHLRRTGLWLLVRTVITSGAMVLLLYLGLTMGEAPLPPITAVDPSIAPSAFLTVNLLLLALVGGLNWKVLHRGFCGLKGESSRDTLPALAWAGAVLQVVVALSNALEFDALKATLFAAPAALILAFSAAGSWLMNRITWNNFQSLNTGEEQVASFILQDEQTVQTLAQASGEEQPVILANRPTGLMEGFVRRSMSRPASEGIQQKLSWLMGAAALVAGLVAWIGTGELFAAVTVLAAALCMGAPLASTLVAALPLHLLQSNASQLGAVVPGWESVEQAGRSNLVVVGAKDLFPARSVRLHGIKTFEKQRIDLAILYAASILVVACDTLRDVFLNIIQGETKILFPVENLENEPGLGFTAWVDGRRMILGNRKMMEKQGVDLPSLDYENRYTKGEKQAMYLAVSGHLFGMFLVSYHPSEQAAQMLELLEQQGVSVLLKSDDFLLTTQLVAQIYQKPEGFVQVLNSRQRHRLEPELEYQSVSEGCICHKGTMRSFVGGLLAADAAAGADKLSTAVLVAGVLVSAVLTLLLAFTSGAAVLALPVLLLYQAAWGVLTLTAPLLRRYS
ncbi:MAG: hypothetical protein H9882_05670 [Candidatus Fournierella pullistercoris]|uniref:Uncharacterized protein n=1 Tax=Candidatus Allofournierella pullistercoris TaxID=2838597 RepID=A0A948WUP6_9FIRM|nr:hypothetical protein [Candidatus Fournierella pullistercoris]